MEQNNRDHANEGYSDHITNLYFNHYVNQKSSPDTKDTHTSMRDIIHGMAASDSKEKSADYISQENLANQDLSNTYETLTAPERKEPKEAFQQFEKDYVYMKSLCPAIVRKIQREIDEQCDQLEYTGSCMFDELPDRIHLSTIINTVYMKVQQYDKDDPELQAEELSYNPLTAMSYRRCSGFSCPPPPPISDYNQYGRPNWMRNLIEVMLYNEMLYRRRRYRCYRC